MMETTQTTEPLFPLTAAARWLKERGVTPNTRHTLYAAIARGRLAVAAVAGRVVCIDGAELERYAKELERASANVSKRKSA